MRSTTIVALVVLIAVCISCVSAYSEDQYRASFVNYTRSFGKAYTLTQMFAKYDAYKATLDDINTHNANPSSTFRKAVNQYSDLTADEFAAMKGYQAPTSLTPELPKSIVSTPVVAPATTTGTSNGLAGVTLDWRLHTPNPVTAVKNQGQCGACWTFSATGVIEGAYALKHNATAVAVSEQNILDCDTTSQSGCNGGNTWYALGWVKTQGGICTESAYGYNAVKGSSCKSSTCTKTASSLASVVQIYSAYQYTYPSTSSSTHISTASETDIISRLANGPVGVAVEADQAAWQSYSGGIVTTATTCGTNLDHAVLITGYGTDPSTNTPYWIIKNQWGTGWGESGYIQIQRGSGMCGIGINYWWVTAN